MCGLAGVARRDASGVSAALLERMAAAIRHRGPDGFGLEAGDRVGLAHVRLSVIDVAGGAQPMANEDGSLRIIYNGEIFNFHALREELAGHAHGITIDPTTGARLGGSDPRSDGAAIGY